MERFARIVVSVTILIIFNINFASATAIQEEFVRKDADLDGFTYQVSIQKSITKQHLCSGAILNNDFILTTCQCVQHLKPSDIKAFYGSRLLNGTGYLGDVIAIICHPYFDAAAKKFDAALILLTASIPFVANVSGSIALPQQDCSGNRCPLIVSGWNAANVVQNRLQYEHTSSISIPECRVLLPKYSEILRTHHICVENVKSNDTYLDLGAPVVSQNTGELLGMVIHREDGANICTNVIPLNEWIKFIIDGI